MPAPLKVKYQWVYNLTSQNTTSFEALTFPSITKHWQGHAQIGHLGGVAASVEGNHVGLILIEKLDRVATILSFFVKPNYRGQGIGTQLLAYAEKAIRQLHCEQMQVTYRISAITAAALEPLLQRQGWQPPQTDFLLLKSHRDTILQAPWLNRFALPDSFTVFPWVELTPGDRADILTRRAYPDELNPFTPDPRLETLNSLGLRYSDRVVGWVVNHRVAEDTVRYSIMFVEPPFQRMGRGISLVIEAIKRQIAGSIDYGTLAVSSQNQPMLRWCDRHLKPYTTFCSESRKAVKVL